MAFLNTSSCNFDDDSVAPVIHYLHYALKVGHQFNGKHLPEV